MTTPSISAVLLNTTIPEGGTVTTGVYWPGGAGKAEVAGLAVTGGATISIGQAGVTRANPMVGAPTYGPVIGALSSDGEYPFEAPEGVLSVNAQALGVGDSLFVSALTITSFDH